jgi:cell division protein FtsL
MWHSRVINIVLLVLVIMGALSVVTSQHKARKLFIGLQQEKDHAHQMEVEWGQLQLEQSTWAAPARVESIASQKLQMQTPRKEQIRFIRIGQTAEGTKAADVAAKALLTGRETVQSGEVAPASSVSDRGGVLLLWDKLKQKVYGAGQSR